MPYCRICEQEKSEDNFYSSVKTRCIKCVLKQSRIKYQNPEFKERCRIYYRNWYLKNGRKRNNKYSIEWVKKNRSKDNIAHKVANLVRVGKKTKPSKCFICGRNETKIYGHHPDYSKPLDILWVCGSCHRRIHNKEFDSMTISL